MGVRLWPPSALDLKAVRLLPSAFVLVGTPPRYRAVASWQRPFPDAEYSMAVIGDDPRTWSYGLKTATSIGVESNSSTAPTGDTLVLAMRHGEARAAVSA